jgi:hypothetical protein
MNAVIINIIFLLAFLSPLGLHATELTSNQLRSGLTKNNFSLTLTRLSNDKSDENELWYWLNLARLQQANGEYKNSINSFEKAYTILDKYVF